MANENKEKCAYRVTDNKCSILKQKRCANCAFYISPQDLSEKQKLTDELLNKRYTKKEREELKSKYELKGS